MDNREQAKMTMLAGTSDFLTNNTSPYSGVPLIVKAVDDFTAKYISTKTAASQTGTDNTGYSQAKDDAKNALADECAALCGFAYIEWNNKYPELAKQLHIADTDYTAVSDSDCASTAQNMHDLLKGNKGKLTDDAVTVADIDTLQTLIDTFSKTQGSSDSAHTTSPANTTAFKNALAASMQTIETLKTAAKKVKKTQPEFYKKLLEVTKIPAVSIRHTYLHINIKDKTTGSPIAGATATFSKGKYTATSDAQGHIVFDKFRAGDNTMTIKKTGYPDYVALIHINGGKYNVFEILMG